MSGGHPPPPPLQQHHVLGNNISSDSPDTSLPPSASDMAYPSPTITPANDSTSAYLSGNSGNNFWTPLNREMNNSLVMQVKAENLSPSQQAIAAAAAAHHSQQYAAHHHHHPPTYSSNPYYPGMDLAYFGGQSLNHQYASHMSSTASMFRSAAGMADPYDAYSADRYQLL